MSRKRILDSAHQVMDLYASGRTVLELEYFNEAGTGLGPTLEFYTLLSHELQKKSLGMWRSEETSKPSAVKGNAAANRRSWPPASPGDEPSGPEAFVFAPLGLFPAPLAEARRVPSTFWGRLGDYSFTLKLLYVQLGSGGLVFWELFCSLSSSGME